MVYQRLEKLAYALLPGYCVVCSCASGRALDLCPPCEELLSRPWPRCRHCGLPGTQDTLTCGHCSRRPFHFQRCVALSPYQPPVSQLISRFKYQRQLGAGKMLSRLLGAQLPGLYRDDHWPDLLMPVPLHWWRQWRRGFNQAHYLCRQLRKQLGLPLADDVLHRQQATASQQGLDRSARMGNLARAFVVKRPLAGEHIALVDDVVTTGATGHQLASLLLEHGAERVDLWCLARTPP